MKKVIYLSIMFLMISLTMSAQAIGGQITRKKTTPTTTSSTHKKATTTSRKPVVASHKTYTVKEQFELGSSFYDKGDYQEAIKWFTKAAENGYPEAQSELGFMYLNGEGVAVNKIEAVKWLAKAGEKGDAMAQQALGYLYKQGDGVPKNIAESNRWYSLAAPQFYEGAKKAMKSTNGGQMALQLFNNVYDMGQAPYAVWSVFHIGEIYYYGKGGIPTNYSEAFKYFKMASDKNTVAMYYLGICYEFGRGTPKNTVKAIEYYKKSGYNNVPSSDF